MAAKNLVELPKLSQDNSSNILSQGHSHFILIGEDSLKLDWGDETKIKLNFAERLASGRKGFSYKCKTLGIILGNINKCEDEIYYFVEKNIPLILIEDSDMSKVIKRIRKGENVRGVSEKMKIISNYKKLIEIEDDSENLASAVHICLTLSF